MHGDVKVGPATKVSVIVSILTLLPPVVTQVVALVENVAAHWSTAERTSLIVGATVAAVTALGRFAQAVAVIVKGNGA